MQERKREIGYVVRSPTSPYVYLSIRLAITGIGVEKQEPIADRFRAFITRDRRLATVFPLSERAEAQVLADKHGYRVLLVTRKGW